MSQRSKHAFYFSVDKLFDYSKAVYVWAFTFEEVQSAWRATEAWRQFRTTLYHWFGRFDGLRVTEMHRDHGIHFHVLVNKRLPIHMLLRLGQKYGFGRMSVQKADRGTARYLAKYLDKENTLPKGMRKWDGIGRRLVTRVCDVEVASAMSDRIKSALATAPGADRSKRWAIVCEERRKHLMSVQVTQCNLPATSGKTETPAGGESETNTGKKPVSVQSHET